jgi:Putative metal-binding domain of cation transport ATPase
VFGLSLFRRPRAADAAPALSPAVPGAGACFHCALPLPKPVVDWVMFDDEKRPMCCPSCAAAAGVIIEAGFGATYRDREASRA